MSIRFGIWGWRLIIAEEPSFRRNAGVKVNRNWRLCLRKAGNTYPDRSSKERRRRPARRVAAPGMKERAKAMPKWLPAVAAISITVMVCLTVNFRAFSELREETDQNKTLSTEIDKKTSENLSLQ